MFRQLQGSSGTSTDSLNPGFNVDNDYQAALTQTAVKNQYDVSISGGNQGFSYFNSIRYVDDQGLILNSWAKQASMRSNLDFSLSPGFKWSTRFQFNYRKRNNISEGNTINQTFQRKPGVSAIGWAESSHAASSSAFERLNFKLTCRSF